MPGRTFAAPSLSIVAATSLAILTGIVATATLTSHTSLTRSYAPMHFAETPAHKIFAKVFAPKRIIVVAAPAQPSAFDNEQKMTYGQLMRRWDPVIAQASKRFGVPVAWIRAVMQLESGGKTMLSESQRIVSRAGAMGLMQLMPQTYDDMRRQFGLGRNAYDPHDNIMAGAAYIRFLRSKYAFPALFEAYNDGPGNLEERMKSGGLLPAETRTYVSNITRKLDGRGIAAKGAMTKFTRPNGEPVWIDAARALSVRAPIPGEYTDNVRSVINFGKSEQGVQEPVGAVAQSLRVHGSAG
jgi:soluble lytic murein transglycosylase-like protein